MTCYIVTFQCKELAVRQSVRARLREYEKSQAIHNTCWAVVTDKKAKDLRDSLRDLIGSGDRLFVVRSGTEAAWRNLPPGRSDWLKENL